MVLGVLEYVYTHHFPSTYTTQVVGTLLVLYTLRTLSLGRKTSRDRTLAARTILLTSPFASSLGITLLCELASRGATVICLSDRLGEAQDLLVSTLREECKNESIFVELCDITLPSSIQTFVGHFLKKENSHNRIDAVVFAHEYPHVGHYLSSNGEEEQRERDKRSLGTFLLTTLLLPNLLVAPQERDIRIVNVVNPFYAAAAKSSLTSQFPSISPSPTKEKKGLFLREGSRALRTIILSRHLQRILDSLPAAQIPKAPQSSNSIPVVNEKTQRSNIVSISVSPGFSRHDTIAHFFPSNLFGTLLYAIIFPLAWLFSKPSSAAVQTILHAMFLPTPFKVFSGDTDLLSKDKEDSSETKEPPKPRSTPLEPEEILKAGALYRECAMVPLVVSLPAPPQDGKKKMDEEGLELVDDGEYGGESVGRMVWESYEGALKGWESEEVKAEEVKAEEVKAEEVKAEEK